MGLKWSREECSHPNFIEGYGGWISIKNFPLTYWDRSKFEAIDHYFGGLESISSQLLWHFEQIIIQTIYVSNEINTNTPTRVEPIKENSLLCCLDYAMLYIYFHSQESKNTLNKLLHKHSMF